MVPGLVYESSTLEGLIRNLALSVRISLKTSTNALRIRSEPTCPLSACNPLQLATIGANTPMMATAGNRFSAKKPDAAELADALASQFEFPVFFPISPT